LSRSEPGSRSDSALSIRRGKSGLQMAAGSGVYRSYVGRQRRRGDPTESATENKPPRETSLAIEPGPFYRSIISRGKGEKAGQEPTVPDGDIGVHGKPPAEQDQVREECSQATRRPVSFDSRVGRLDKWLPPSTLSGKTEFGLSAHSFFVFPPHRSCSPLSRVPIRCRREWQSGR